MIHTENPAARLTSFFEEGKKISGNGTTQAALEKLLEVKGDNTVLLVRLAKIVALPMEIKGALEKLDAIDDQHKIYLLKWQNNVEKALGSISFGMSWAKCINNVKSDDIALLGACSHTLRPLYKNAEVDQVAVDSYIERLNELLKEIADSDLLIQTKEYAIQRIREIRTAFENIKFTGSELPQKEIEATIGSLVLHQDIRSDLAGNNSGEKFFKALAVGSDLLSISASSLTLAHVLTSAGLLG